MKPFILNVFFERFVEFQIYLFNCNWFRRSMKNPVKPVYQSPYLLQCRRSLHPYSLYHYHSSNFQNPNYLHLSTSKFLPIIMNMYIGTSSENMYICRGLVTFVKSFPPIQEFPLNLALIKELASLSGTVARIESP